MSYTKTINDYLEALALDIRANMARLDVNATGRTSRSIEVTTKLNTGQLLASSVLEATETGNPPAGQGGGIKLDAAELWIQVRGLSLNAYGLKNRIDKQGTQLFQAGGRTSIYTEVVEDRNLQDIFIVKIAEDTSASIINALN